MECQIRRLNDLGFAVEEVQLESSRDASAARMAVEETPTGQLSAVAPVEEPPDSSPAPSAWDL